MKTADCRKNGCLELRTFTNEHERTETLCNVAGRIPGNSICPKESKHARLSIQDWRELILISKSVEFDIALMSEMKRKEKTEPAEPKETL